MLQYGMNFSGMQLTSLAARVFRVNQANPSQRFSSTACVDGGANPQASPLWLVLLNVRCPRHRIANHQHSTAFPAVARLPDCFINPNLR